MIRVDLEPWHGHLDTLYKYTCPFCLNLSAEGFYIYHESDNVANGQKVRLLSPALSSSATQICVQFRYYMYGSDNTNVFRVLTKRPGAEEEVWKKTGFQSPSWLKGSVTVSKSSSESVNVSVSRSRFFVQS